MEDLGLDPQTAMFQMSGHHRVDGHAGERTAAWSFCPNVASPFRKRRMACETVYQNAETTR